MKRPHIVTHLFADGGRIIKSTRTDYSEHLGEADVQVTIRRLMKDQHKAMFIALRDGQLNETIDQVLGPVIVPPEGASSARPSKGLRRSKPPPTLSDVAAGVPMTLPPDLEEPPLISSGSPIVARRAAPTLTDLVLADLETARARPGTANPVSSGRPPLKGTPALGTPVVVPPRTGTGTSGRYAAARPAAIFSGAPEGAANIFGSASISEQSLDEVILSYLAEDLDGSSDE